MSYQIIWHPKAAKNFEKLPTVAAERIADKFNEVALEPFRYLEHYEGDYYKLRIGDYRALIDIDFGKKVIKVQVFDVTVKLRR